MVTLLCSEFPEFEKGVIEGLLFDQGNDLEEVTSYLQVRTEPFLH